MGVCVSIVKFAEKAEAPLSVFLMKQQMWTSVQGCNYKDVINGTNLISHIFMLSCLPGKFSIQNILLT